MSIEELLKPRFKVIADWLGNDCFIVGDIFFDDDIRRTTKKWKNAVFSGFPHLFKKLEWWEERKKSDMPEYAYDNAYDNKIGKVIRVLDRGVCITQKDNLVNWVDCYPATKEEYQNQNKQ